MVTEVCVISDTHFFDINIIKNLKRPFECLQDMHEYMIMRWNDVVCKDDIIVHLGDFSVKYNTYELIPIINRLNGKKVLITGNHDKMTKRFYKTIGFDRVEYDVVKIGDYIFSHKPIIHKIVPLCGINYHGHSHKYQYGMPYINCNVDVMGFDPKRVNLWDIKREEVLSV